MLRLRAAVTFTENGRCRGRDNGDTAIAGVVERQDVARAIDAVELPPDRGAAQIKRALGTVEQNMWRIEPRLLIAPLSHRQRDHGMKSDRHFGYLDAIGIAVIALSAAAIVWLLLS
jgi:hypothetical protein